MLKTFTPLLKVLLHAVAQKPSTGYDIARKFMPANEYHWLASHQQVYRDLDRLHDDCYVAFEVEPQEGKPDKKVYALTPSGEKAYAQICAELPEGVKLAMNSEVTVHALFGNKAYFISLFQQLHDETEKLYVKKCESAGDKLTELLVDRRILLLNADMTFAQQMVKLLSEQEEAAEE